MELTDVLADIATGIADKTELKAQVKIQQLKELEMLFITVHY